MNPHSPCHYFWSSPSWHWRLRRWRNRLNSFFRTGGFSGAGVSVSRVILLANLVLFTLMVAHGLLAGLGPGVILSPPTRLLLAWGGQFWPAVLEYGQWWRCLTYAFTHGGLIHLGFNMVVLYQVGPLIESELGSPRFLVLYTLTAVTGTLAGYLWHPQVPVVGASGALFGLIGFAIAYYHRLGAAGEQIRNFMLQWALFAFVFGLLVGADNAGHLGGALGGAAFGWLLPLRYRANPFQRRLFQVLAWVCAAALLASLALLLLWVVKS